MNNLCSNFQATPFLDDSIPYILIHLAYKYSCYL